MLCSLVGPSSSVVERAALPRGAPCHAHALRALEAPLRTYPRRFSVGNASIASGVRRDSHARSDVGAIATAQHATWNGPVAAHLGHHRQPNYSVDLAFPSYRSCMRGLSPRAQCPPSALQALGESIVTAQSTIPARRASTSSLDQPVSGPSLPRRPKLSASLPFQCRRLDVHRTAARSYSTDTLLPEVDPPSIYVRAGMQPFAAADVPSPHELAAAARVRIREDVTKRVHWRSKFLAKWHAGEDMNSLLSVPRQKSPPFSKGAQPLVLNRDGQITLNPRYVARYIMRERATKSLAQVMPAVEELIAHGFEPNAYTLSALLAKDVWRVDAMLDIARVLRVAPNHVNWSQTMNNAMRERGPLSALDVYDVAPAVDTSAVQNVAGALLNRTPFYRPDAHAMQRVRDMYRRQISARDPDDNSRLEVGNLLAALVGTHAVPGAREEVAFFLRWVKDEGAPLHAVPAVARAIEGVFRAASFDEAVAAVWATDGIRAVPYAELLALLGRVCRLRFRERSTLPFDTLQTFIARIRAGGDEPDAAPFVIALVSYGDAGVQLHIAEEAAAVDAGAHLALARDDVAHVEAHLRDAHGELADVRIVAALARAHSALGSLDDALRLWRAYRGAPSAPLVQVLLSGCRRHARLDVARDVLANARLRGFAPDARTLALWCETLADLGALEEAVATFEVHCNYGGPRGDMARSAIRVLRWVSGRGEPKLRARMLEGAPEIWTDPKIMEDYDLNSDQRRRRVASRLLQRLQSAVPKVSQDP